MGKQSHRTQSVNGPLARYNCSLPLSSKGHVELQHLASLHSRLKPTFPVMSRILEEDVVLSGYNVPAKVSKVTRATLIS